MAAGNTTDTRTHVMGDMLMVTGTFTDGGLDVYVGDHITNIVAAGGHYTSHADTTINVNNGSGYPAGETGVIAVDTGDPLMFFNVGDTIYNSAGARVGVITAIANSNSIQCSAGTLVALANNDAIHKFGAAAPAITLMNDNLDISIDTTNKYVIIGCGNMGASSTAATGDGQWWILGTR